MSALERLQNYSAKNNIITNDVFDTSTPEGCFLAKLHQQGYLMYEYVYEDSTGKTLSEKEFNWLQDDEQQGYTRKIKYTELHDMLTTDGDQLVLANAGSGKALANTTKVLTTEGYKPIGSLTTEDMVFGTDLKPHKIKGVYPQGKKVVNTLTIDCDKFSTYNIDCCDEHLWAIEKDDDIEVISTKDIKKRFEYESSLSLVDLDYVDISTLSASGKARLFLHIISNLFVNADFITSKVNNTIEPSCRIYLKEFKSDSKFLIELSYYLGSKYAFIYSDNDVPVLIIDCDGYLTQELYDCSKLNILAEMLLNIFRTKEKDTLNIFDNEKLKYKITGIEEKDSEVEMTCIEVDSSNHLFLIEGLIPTHNTTALIFKIMHDIITGEATKMTSIPNGNEVRVVDDIFVGTFLKTGADELAERLAYWQRGLGYTVTADRVNFSTLHAEFKRALNTMGAATPIGKPADINKCLKKAIDNLGITRDGNSLSSEDYNVIGGIITYYRGRLDNKRYSHPSAYDYGLTPTLLDRLVSDFTNQRQLAGIMDFEDLQELLYKFLYVTPNKAVQDFCANRYKYIYLDEFQDTSQIQYAIIKFYARGRLWMNRGSSSEEDEKSPLYTGNETMGKIVVVGDNDQCVVGDTHIRMSYPGECSVITLISNGKATETTYTISEDFKAIATEREVPVDSVNNDSKDFEYLDEYKPISQIKKGDFVCCADSREGTYSMNDDEISTKYKLFIDMPTTKVIEEPIVHKRKNIDLYKITVVVNCCGESIPMSLECSGDHILFTDDKNLSIPNDLYNTLIEGTEEGSTERGFFTLGYSENKTEFTMVFAKDLSVGDNVLVEIFAGELKLLSIESIEVKHYDEVDLYDIRTDARNYSSNGFISHNCLYQWRGSDNSIIETDFDNDFRPCHSSLSYNYRCPSNILDAIIPSIKMNKGHENREYHSSREGGIARGYHFSTYKSMLNQLIKDIDEDMQEGNTVAILCRTNYDGVIPAFILEANKHYDFSISGQNMTFDSPLPRKLIAVTSIFTERSSTSVKNTLSMFVPRYAEWGVKQLVDTLKNNGKSVWQIPEADIDYSCPELSFIIKKLKEIFYENGKRNQKKEVEALKCVYEWVMKNTFGGNSLYCESARAYIEALLYIIDSNNFESVFEFLEYVNTVNERLHARINNTKAKICIATVHEFKGKERDSVIVWNDSDGVFPSSKTDIDNEEELEGERMVHYVACTRAKKKNTIYTMYGKESIFVNEMNLQFESPQQIGGTLKTNSDDSDLSDEEKNLLDVMKSIETTEITF